MKKIVFALLMSAVATVPMTAQQVVAAAVEATVAKPLYDSEGKRVGVVYSVTADGSAQIMYDDRLITIPDPPPLETMRNPYANPHTPT